MEMEDYFDRNGIEVLLKIPFDRKIAESYSKGILPIIDFPEFKNEFVLLYNRIKEKLEMENVDA
jgi:MinD superfamily P-loop ATPase